MVDVSGGEQRNGLVLSGLVFEFNVLEYGIALPPRAVVGTQVDAAAAAVNVNGAVLNSDKTVADEVDMLDGGVLYSSVVNAAVCVEGAKEVAVEGEVLTVVSTHNALVGNAAVRIKEYVLNYVLPKNVVGVGRTHLIRAHTV